MTLRKQLVPITTVLLLVLLGVMGEQRTAQSADDHTAGADGARAITIVGGQPAAPGAWPWQVFIYADLYMCGGTLLDESWVLTAAHCVTDDQNHVLAASAIKVTLGEHNRNVSEDTEQEREITQVIRHPAYNARINDNDLALLQLATPVLLGNAVNVIRPVVDPADYALSTEGVQAVATGWGTTAEGGYTSPELREVTVPLVSNQQCNRTYGFITENMLCAGYQDGGKDSCQGDSGGPLVVPTSEGGWKLAGIVSFGYGCARPGFYGVYTRVARYNTWLAQYVSALADLAPTIPKPSSTLLLPEQETTVIMTGTNQTTTILEIPAGAVTVPTELIYSETPLPRQGVGAIRTGSRALTLNARQDNLPLAALTFHQPVTVTIFYTDEEINTWNEAEIALFALQPNNGSWSDAGIVLIEHAPDANRLIVTIREAAEYALGVPNRPLFLPIVMR